MPSLSVLKTVCRELITTERSIRVNEPDLVMDDPDKVAAYTRAGREDGVMAPVYLFHCAQICEIIRPGDTVIDLGCGPATQLAMVARLNPHTRFIGIDLSPDMLGRAHNYIAEQELGNVEFRTEDISQLTSLHDQSVDAVISTVALHHLPDIGTLEKTFSEIRRVLKPNGGVYIVDFGHLKSEKVHPYFCLPICRPATGTLHPGLPVFPSSGLRTAGFQASGQGVFGWNSQGIFNLSYPLHGGHQKPATLAWFR